MAVVEGVVFPHATKRVHIAGHHVSKQLLELLQARGYALSTSRDRHLVSAAKEKLCYVALDSQQEAKVRGGPQSLAIAPRADSFKRH